MSMTELESRSLPIEGGEVRATPGEEIHKAMDLCAQLRDEESPESWGPEFTEGFKAGCDNCLSLIFNEIGNRFPPYSSPPEGRIPTPPNKGDRT